MKKQGIYRQTAAAVAYLAFGATAFARRRLRRFARDEDGALLVFGLILIFFMVMMGGVAVDLMRHETKRTTLQQTQDRSVLAASSLQQELEPESVVRDYFAKAGMTEYLRSVTVEEGLNYRRVTAQALADTNPFFMHMVGIDDFYASASSSAEQRITNVEIALVLDISGSMYNSYSRIANLKSAASEFVETLLAGDTDDHISIALVPYNGQVNLGPTLFSKYMVSYQHGYPDSHCIDVPIDTYATTAMSRSAIMPQAGFFDSWSSKSAQAPYYDSSRGLYSNT